jgi:DNA-cytosine methyltransferase
MIKILDVCSGIGGFSLGLEATGGFDTVAFCEFDEFCGKVLNKHWPDVPIYKDLKEIGNEPTRLIQEFDLICGGIPCQPFSLAGKQKGKEDDRHLWPYMFEIIKHKKPTWVIVENVGGFVNVALDDVCLDLETEGYATQSFIIPACGVEAPHRRERVWILGKITKDDSNSDSIGSHRETINEHGSGESNDGQEREPGSVRQVLANGGDTEIGATRDVVNSERYGFTAGEKSGGSEETIRQQQEGEENTFNFKGASGLSRTERNVANTKGKQRQRELRDVKQKNGEKKKRGKSDRRGSQPSNRSTGGATEDVADSSSEGSQGEEWQGSAREKRQPSRHPTQRSSNVPYSGGERGRSWQADRQDAKDVGELTGSQEHREGNTQPRLGGMDDGVSARLDGHQGFITEPDIPRVAEKIPDRVNRLKALGNSIVPQIIYHIGMAILEEERKNK